MNIPSIRIRTVFSFLVVISPIILLLLGADFFDNGQSICISKLVLDRDCPGCGMTRAVQHSIHGEWAIAYDYNKLIVIVGPILIYLWLIELRNLIRFFKSRN